MRSLHPSRQPGRPKTAKPTRSDARAVAGVGEGRPDPRPTGLNLRSARRLSSRSVPRRHLMLKDHDSSAIVAVSDLDRAGQFYGDVLGLELADEGKEEGVLVYRTGATQLVVYQSEYAGTNRANAVVWGVGDDLAALVPALEAKRSEEHTSELQSLMRISYAVFCLKKNISSSSSFFVFLV